MEKQFKIETAVGLHKQKKRNNKIRLDWHFRI